MTFQAIAAVALIQLHGPAGQVIEINPAQVVSMRQPRSTDHFGPGTRCLINTADGHFIAVQETCDMARLAVQGAAK